ncbi:MAG: hypothetical protein QJR05_11870 [Thermoanaerobacterium sp.]|nr:hypothetical protein [Thermoanaerobacterium sp.]
MAEMITVFLDPADPQVPISDRPGRGAEAEQDHDTQGVMDNIAYLSAGILVETEIMVAANQLPPDFPV